MRAGVGVHAVDDGQGLLQQRRQDVLDAHLLDEGACAPPVPSCVRRGGGEPAGDVGHLRSSSAPSWRQQREKSTVKCAAPPCPRRRRRRRGTRRRLGGLRPATWRTCHEVDGELEHAQAPLAASASRDATPAPPPRAPAPPRVTSGPLRGGDELAERRRCSRRTGAHLDQRREQLRRGVDVLRALSCALSPAEIISLTSGRSPRRPP